MHIARWTRWGAVALAGASLVTFGSTPVAAAPKSSDGSASHAATNSPAATSGQLPLTGTGQLTLGTTTGTGGTPHALYSALPNRLGVPRTAGSTPAHATALPIAKGAAMSSNGKLLQSFDGVSNLDNATTQGIILTPPDQGLCVGPLALAGGQEILFEPVNITLGIFTTTGTNLATVPLNLLFNEPSSEFISDPRCHYDAATGDFFATILAFDPSGSESHISVSVITQSGGFFNYRFDTTDFTNGAAPVANGRGCPCFADQPLLGMDSQNLYVTGNEFPINQPSPYYNGAEIYAISKSQLAAGGTVNYAEFSNISDGGILIETLQPAIEDTSAPAEYFMHSFTVDVNGNNSNFDNRLGVFAMTNTSAVTAGGIPTLSNPTIVNSESYVQPNVALQPSNVNLNPDDDRMQQVQYMKGSLYGALSSAVSIPGDGTRTGVAWFQLKPTVTSSGAVKAKIAHQGYLGLFGGYLLYPAIEANYKGVIEMAFSVTGATINPSAGYAVNNGSGFGTNIYAAAFGNGTYSDSFTCTGSGVPGCRWGDYSYAVFDGLTDEIWMGSEYIPPVSRQFPDANWGTRLYLVKA